MKLDTFLPFVLAVFLAGCGNNQSTSGSAPAPAPSNPIKAPEAANAPAAAPANATAPKPAKAPVEGGYLGGLANAKSQAVATVDVASLTQAISMFNIDEGRYPRSLQELVDQKYIGQIPAAPYGKKLDYNATSGVIRVVDQ